MLISTALLLDSNIRNSVCTPAKLPCRRVEVGYDEIAICAISTEKTLFLRIAHMIFSTGKYNLDIFNILLIISKLKSEIKIVLLSLP
jgi:hypothetical protein